MHLKADDNHLHWWFSGLCFGLARQVLGLRTIERGTSMNSKAMILGIVTSVLSAQALAIQPASGERSQGAQGLGVESAKPNEVVGYVGNCPFPFVPPQCN
jgi:hypothetical protein